jgi:arginine exporter protein ArgO
MKTDNKIPIKCGYLMFRGDRLSISDNSKTIHIVTFVLLIASCILGISYLVENSASTEPLLFYMGILIVLTSGMAMGFMLTRTVKGELFYSDIHQIRLKKNYNGDFIANIKLKKGRIRYVALTNNQLYCDSFLNKTNEFSIQTELTN